MYIRTIGPLHTPLHLARGLDPRSDFYPRLLKAIPAEDAEIEVPNRHSAGIGGEFTDSRADDLDLRLFTWSPAVADGEVAVKCHVFPNGVSVLETTFPLDNITARPDLETEAQEIAQQAFDRHAARFSDVLQRVRRSLPADAVESLVGSARVTSANIGWLARAVMMTDAERRDSANAAFIRNWLETSARPEDAEAILDGSSDAAMTWLNYVVVETDAEDVRNLFAAARTAQFFYAAQDRLNLAAQNALGSAETGKAVRTVEKELVGHRRRMQMLRILYDTQKSYLSRFRRRKFDDLMSLWDYQDLVENGERIVEATNSRISEITTRRAERSSFVTDLILVAIALVTVIEVSLYFTEYSREVMSRPALGYTDKDVSWILSWVASIDTDAVLLGGTLIILLLVVIYVYWKRRR